MSTVTMMTLLTTSSSTRVVITVIRSKEALKERETFIALPKLAAQEGKHPKKERIFPQPLESVGRSRTRRTSRYTVDRNRVSYAKHTTSHAPHNHTSASPTATRAASTAALVT